jgi:hypothetical protein
MESSHSTSIPARREENGPAWAFNHLPAAEHPSKAFRWRTHPDLKVNFFWLLFYVTEHAGQQNKATPNPVNRVWFDDIVVAKQYIGPICGVEEKIDCEAA